jgi:hypothetical protein
VAHRLDPLIQRVHEEHREYLARGAGVPIRRLRVDAGMIAICGDSEGLDRRGRQAITFVRPDGRLTLLTLADAADVDAQCVKYKAAPLALVEPYRVFFRGKPREFRATARPFLMGVCDCEGETILVACVDGGLLFCVTVEDGGSRTWARFAEASWAPFDLDNALRIQTGEEPIERPQAPRARGKGRGPSRQVEDCDDVVQEHHERLAAGVVAEQRCMSILAIAFEQLHQKAQLPNAAFAGRYLEGRKDTAAVTAGLLKAIAGGCGDLGGRERDMRETLRKYGVVLPRGALTAVLRIFLLLGCPLVSQPEPAKGRKISKRWNVDVVAALDPKNPKHLSLLEWTDTPLRRRSTVAAEGPPDDAQGPTGEASGSATAAGTEQQTQANEPAAPADAAAGEPADPVSGTSSAAAADTSAQRSWPAEPIQACIALVLGTLSLMTQEIVRLHQRLDDMIQVAAPGEHRPAEADVPDIPATQAADEGPRGPDGADEQDQHEEQRGEGQQRSVDVGGAAAVDGDSEAAHERDDGEAGAASSDIHASVYVDVDPNADAAPALVCRAGPHPVDAGRPDIGPSADTILKRTAGGWVLSLDRWSFATVVFMALFEVEDPRLVQAVVRSVIAWSAASGSVDWSGEHWSRWLHHPETGALHGLACAEQLRPAEVWLGAQPECGDTGPRGPPPLG